mmetsp:Transcript_3793/g.8072  ORF Transcript_3793/g.8072 Transcript_3793/m.8072 type:complete len:175 (+) Transcript_3793:1411-1935(+)
MESKISAKQAEIKQITDRIGEYTRLAVSLKQEGNTQEALQTLKHIKVMKVELATHEKLLKAYLAAAGDTPSSGETVGYVSLAVLHFEISNANSKGDKATAKRLRKQVRTLKSKIESGRLDQSEYCLMLESAIAELASKDNLSQLEAMHLELMQNELRLDLEGTQMQPEEGAPSP